MGRRRRRNDRGRRRERGVGFWGDADQLPEPNLDVKMAEDPAAVVHSLGEPPLQGREQVAMQYFKVIYERIVMVGGALAGAGGMIEVDELMEQRGHDEDWDDSDEDW